MSKIYTVTTLTTGTEFPYTVEHADYQDAIESNESKRLNEAMKKWHHESSYKRNVGGFFRSYIQDEDGKIIKEDSNSIIGASESKLFSLIFTVNGEYTDEIQNFNNFNAAMMEFHNACESKRSDEEVTSYVARIENEWGSVEIEEKYNSTEV